MNQMKFFRNVALCVASLLPPAFCRGAEATSGRPSNTIQFNRDIRAILSENCFSCHGPDKNKRKADLRLDMETGGALVDHKGHFPIVAGQTTKSELFTRITSKDPDKLMPPPDSGKKLTTRQIDLLRQWIDQGAEWQPLWSFIPPQRPSLPAVKDTAWCRNPIDRFILARLESEGLKPSLEADKARLIRRLYLDLLGLPPSISQVDAFVSDNSPDAYGKVVDQLLANPHYGERMALDWLDAARFADTHGYHIDTARDMTRWREWVIDSFNRNLPFDQFTVQQIAGDLLPNATVENKIASGFCRNNMVNFEGGAIPEEYHTAYIIDRVNTMGMVWLGLTVGCCQCHDHKFDPITQKEYYQLFAFFNNVPENGLDGKKGNAVPFIRTPTDEQKQKLKELAGAIDKTETELLATSQAVDDEQAEWEKTSPQNETPQWVALAPMSVKSAGGATLTVQDDKSVVATGTNPPTETYTFVTKSEVPNITGVRLEALPDENLAGHGPGRSVNGNIVLTDFRVRRAKTGKEPAELLKIKTAVADFSQDRFPITSAIDKDRKSGWAIYPQVGQPHAAVFELEHFISSDGSVPLVVVMEFKSEFGQHQLGKFRLSVTNAKEPLGSAAMPGDVRKALSITAVDRTPAQQAQIRDYFRRDVSPQLQPIRGRLASLRKDQAQAEATVRTTMVMEEMAKPRDTFVLMRGQYDKPGDKVTADVPKSLPSISADAPHNRLGLAQWLVSPNQPLTARVAVNRYWQAFFGTGIVKTAEDFGSQGEEPTHPLLLDWLACEFTNPTDAKTPKWDVKALVRLIVTSATYRQSSSVSPELLARDPDDRLLARGARYRLPAEFIRDQALAISGLLNDEIGGRSVSPYQPPGLWEELMSRGDGANFTAQVYVQDHGGNLYRRTMYTFWKRTSPPASLSTFDAPDRETCTVRRSRTNTPLQALVLMNDPTYVEASRKLAEKILKEAAPDAEAKIAFVFRLAMARGPDALESAVLKNIYDAQLAVYRADPAAAENLLKVGESPRDEKLDPCELAAWTTVASVVLNLDETITKE